jgi:O-antigen ligase
LTLVIIAVGILSVFLGLLQVAQGEKSALRFFEITNPLEAVGFFANRNHFAALLYCLIPLVAAWTLDKMAGSASSEKTKPAPSSYLALSSYNVSSIIAAIAGFTTLVIILAGEVTARSRAGLGLTIVALFSAMALSSSSRRVGHKFMTPNIIILGAIVLAVVFSLQFSLFRMGERFSDSQQGDRLSVALTTLEAVRAYMPIGAGLGTFRTVYAMFEKPEQVSLFFVNRAHDDILELSLETGVVGLIMMSVFALLVVRRSMKIWRESPPDGASGLDWSLARAATIVVALLVAHSFVDYPLRTGGMMTIMAFACAVLIEPLVVVQSLEEPRAVGVKEWTSGTRALETANTARPTLRSMSPDTRKSAKSSAESPTALNRTGNTVTPRSSTSSPSKPIESASLSKPTGGLQRLQGLQAARPQKDRPAQRSKSPEELQAALNRIQEGEPAQTSKSTEQPKASPNGIQQTGMASAESMSPATARSLPSQLSEAAQGPSIPAERRWGIDVEWPEAWSKAPAKDSAAKNESQPTTTKKQE